ncbi:MAG: hypothetical protein F8N37_22670 [Telmatospirillum sp.]|nr:hypothetical protein [Telmatospirillum sp.]
MAVAGFGHRDYYVAVVPRQQAVKIILANHYSHRIVNNFYVHLGVFLTGELVGILQFGYAMNPRRVDKVVANTLVGEYLELNRMWLDDKAPRNSESQAISYALKYIKRACPTVKWCQSFADERCGGLGVVYQACNFLYLGSHKTTFYDLDGETYHEMLLTAHKKGGRRGQILRDNITRATPHQLRQFRYLIFLRPAFRKDLRMLPKPYPKRAGHNAC